MIKLAAIVLAVFSGSPLHCCRDSDYQLVPCDEIASHHQWVYWHGMRTLARTIKPSPDGECHVCSNLRNRQIKCIFMPPASPKRSEGGEAVG